ncbi:MAG: 50S ribosomal protein L25/general stress protein Ctc, partial [Limnohabitans sp.]
ERAKQGTGASRRLRITGRTPGIVYGGTAEPTLIEIDHNALWHALKKEAFHASVLQMEYAGKTTEVLLRDVQYHPFKQLVLHIDFQRIDGNTKMKKKVPVHYSGEENSPAVKIDQCLINHIATELEVSCMPKDLPEFISVDLSNLTKGHSLHVNDITLPAGVTAVTRGKSNPVLVAVVATKAEAPTPQEAAAAAGTDKKKK